MIKAVLAGIQMIQTRLVTTRHLLARSACAQSRGGPPRGVARHARQHSTVENAPVGAVGADGWYGHAAESGGEPPSSPARRDRDRHHNVRWRGSEGTRTLC
eukprot:scaffold24646_cov129-Isochrysis_galbana.AAC.8